MPLSRTFVWDGIDMASDTNVLGFEWNIETFSFGNSSGNIKKSNQIPMELCQHKSSSKH